MYQGTTHLLVLEVEDVDLSQMSKVQVSIRTINGKLITKTTPEIDVATGQIAIRLEQVDTLALPEGSLRCQVRWIDANGNVNTSEVGYVDVTGIQTDNVIVGDDES